MIDPLVAMAQRLAPRWEGRREVGLFYERLLRVYQRTGRVPDEPLARTIAQRLWRDLARKERCRRRHEARFSGLLRTVEHPKVDAIAWPVAAVVLPEPVKPGPRRVTWWAALQWLRFMPWLSVYDAERATGLETRGSPLYAKMQASPWVREAVERARLGAGNGPFPAP